MLRKIEMAEAALLPNQKRETIRSKLNEIWRELMEIEHGDKIDEIEVLAQERLRRHEELKKARRMARRNK